MFTNQNIKHNEVLAPYSTYTIGGPADYFLVVQNKSDLITAIKEAQENHIPYFILGTGANILFGDKGFRGLVIKNEANTITSNNEQITAESGTTIEELINQTAKMGLSGFEHFAGIPSTVGGALWQNLHFLSPDRSRTIFIEEILLSATILDENHNVSEVNKDFFQFGYDQSILHHKNLIVLEAVFQLKKKPRSEIYDQITKNLMWRQERQPPLAQYPSCGSVFKKIEGVGAGRLIEKVGLKGYQIGGIKSSEQHANFLINTGNGTASDVRNLITFIQEKVKKETGHELQTEISFIGEF